MVHALSNSGYSVNVEIVTILCFFVKLGFKILHTEFLQMVRIANYINTTVKL